MVKAAGGADGITLVDASALLSSLEQKAAGLKRKGLAESHRLVAGDIRVLKAMIPRLIAGHPPIAEWERHKRYERGDLIVAEGATWKLTNGDGAKRADWEEVVSAGQRSQPPPAKPVEVEDEIADLLKDLVGLDDEEARQERRAIERYRESVKDSGITPAQLDLPVTIRMQMHVQCSLIERTIDALHARDKRIEKLEAELKARFDEIKNRLVELANANASAFDERFAAIEARAAKLETDPFDIDETIEDGGRVVVRRFMRSGEVISEKRHITATMLYRGIHSETAFYLPGDAVTRGGSLWICRVECTGRFNGDFWILAVKKGRDSASHE
ncbi:hypothetical protein MPLSOD_110123 [Mesorhizobium sp. SOD10]|nr:hypothetical protein MPLSOD_110123 [Mesorhizobium sp. SOD10]